MLSINTDAGAPQITDQEIMLIPGLDKAWESAMEHCVGLRQKIDKIAQQPKSKERDELILKTNEELQSWQRRSNRILERLIKTLEKF